MKKEEYIYNAVKIVFSVMVQSTLSIENFFGCTVESFNRNVLDFYDKWCYRYEKEKNSTNCSESMRDAIIMSFLYRYREETVKNSLKYINENIINKLKIPYNIEEKFACYESDIKIKNPYEQIIIDLRKLSEEKDKNYESGKEVSVVNCWFDEKELKMLRQNRIDKYNYVDGELGGHLTQNKISNDLSYLADENKIDKLFDEMVIGVVSSDK